jgi:glycosyltransferase involved in cell wall biosynthesis
MKIPSAPLVSVIVTTKNEERHIADCLESIKQQTYDNIEIIVVDYASKDKTKQIARRFTDKVYSIEGAVDLSKIKNYRGAQLNYGAKKSKGDIIFFPDADMTFDSELVSEAVQLMKKYDAVYVPETICGKGFFGKVRDFERSFYNGTCIDAVRFVKRKIFMQVGGFDEKNIMFGPDDWDFTKMVKQKTRHISITTVHIYHHEENLDVNTYLNKKNKYTTTFEGYVKKWGKNDPDVRRQLGARYRLFGVFVENGKWKKCIRNPVKLSGMIALRILTGTTYLFRKKPMKGDNK